MKTELKILLIVYFIFTILFGRANSQTPYDSYAPSCAKIAMLKLPEIQYRTYNPDTLSKVSYVELNSNIGTLAYYDKKDNLLYQSNVNPLEQKWWTKDPLASKYPSKSPYIFSSNNPIIFIDKGGDDDFYFNTNGILTGYVKSNKDANRVFLQNAYGSNKFANENYSLKLLTDREIRVNPINKDALIIIGIFHDKVLGQNERWLNNGKELIEYKISSTGKIGEKANQLSGDSPAGVIDLINFAKNIINPNEYKGTINDAKSKASYQEHHIMPQSFASNPVVSAAVRAGFNLLKGIDNLVYLPTKLLDGTNMHLGDHPAYRSFMLTYIQMQYKGNSDLQAKEFIKTKAIPFAIEQINNAFQSGKSFDQYFKDKENGN